MDVCWRLVRPTGAGLLRLALTKTGESGERLIPLPSCAVTMLKRRRLAFVPGVQPVFPDSLNGWRDDAAVPTRKISDQLGHCRVSMTQDHFLGRKLTDRQDADVLEKLMGSSGT